MIIGIGLDVVSVERLAAARRRHPGLAGRLDLDGMTLTPTALAGRFAAKEALAKALGAVPGGRWVEAVITHDATGAPAFLLRGAVLARAEELGVARIHLSISHDCGVATAMVVLEGKSQVTRYNIKLGAGAVRGATPRHQTSQLFREET